MNRFFNAMRPGRKQTSIEGGEVIEQRTSCKSRLATAACLIYLGFTSAVWLLLRTKGDHWWMATIFLFGPLWVLAVPAVILLPVTVRYRPKSLWILLAAVGIIVGPIMGLCVPWRSVSLSTHAKMRLRILTCNTHDGALDPFAMAKLIKQTNPDIVALQEWTPGDQAIVFEEPQWRVIDDEYLCLACRFPAIRVQRVIPLSSAGWGAAFQYEITTPAGEFQFVNVHLASPHGAFSAALHGKEMGQTAVETNSQRRVMQWRLLKQTVQDKRGRLLLVGDFNTRLESPIYKNSALDVSDAFEVAGFGFGWTYYYSTWTSARIDHVLFTAGWQCRNCWVGPNVGSPHRPLIADMEWIDQPN